MEANELPVDRRRRLLRQFSKVMRTSLGTGLMGTLFTYPSVLASDLQHDPTSLYGTPLHIDGLQDLVGSLLMLSSLPGAWFTATLAMKLGRRKGMMVNGCVAVVGWLGMAFIPYPAGILLSRCVSGLSLGGMSVIINAYVAELSDNDVRGMMSMCLNLAILLGQIFTVSLGYVARYYTVAIINALVPGLFTLFLICLPESPSVLVIKGKEDKAAEVLLELRGPHADVRHEINSYKMFNKSQAGQGGTWKSLIRPDIMKTLVVVSTLFTLVAFSGYLVVNANAMQMLEAAGTSVDPGIASIVLMTVQFVGGILGFFLVDKIGRKNILYLGFILMSVSLGVLASYCGVRQGSSQDIPEVNVTSTTVPPGAAEEGSGVALGWLPLACLGVSQTAVSLGVNVMPFILNQEYFPTYIRSQASGVCFTIWTLTTFTILQLYTPMATSLTQAGLYGFYSIICLLGLPFTFFLIRETAGEAVG